jgi:hypothetical protein
VEGVAMDAVLMSRKFTNWFLATVTLPTSRKAVLKKENIFNQIQKQEKGKEHVICSTSSSLESSTAFRFFAVIILNILS